MTFAKTISAWYRHYNHMPRSKPRSYYTDYGLWYDGDVAYYRDTPVMRWLRTDTGELAVLIRSTNTGSEYRWRNIMEEVIGLKVSRIFIESQCIGVFSPIPGDRLDGKPLFDRLRRMLSHQMQVAIERIPEGALDVELALRKIAGAPRDNMLEMFRIRYERVKREWDDARMLFEEAMSWGPMPDYLTEYQRVFEQALAEYGHPKAVEKRERAAARRLARKVFGIDKAA